MRSGLLLVLLLLVNYESWAQYSPSENAILNYRIIGFRLPPLENVNEYSIEIAEGHFTNSNEFNQNIIKKISAKENKVLAEVPFFGKEYTWRVIGGNATRDGETLHHFSTGYRRFLDPDTVRMRITHVAEKFRDAYVFMDGCKALYNMDGQPVWFMPSIDSLVDARSMVRDLKYSGKGSITFLGDRGAFDISYDGRVLWKNKRAEIKITDSADVFHHELTKLSNGHYMVLGYEAMSPIRRVVKRDSLTGRIIRDSSRKLVISPDMIRYGTIFEYDSQNSVIWEYRPKEYFKTLDLSAYANPNGLPEYDPHLNSFYFDEKERAIYLSYRNLSQILKLTYPQGKVVANYGRIKLPAVSNVLFCGQHSCKISSDGHLYLFNNGCSVTSPPTIAMFNLFPGNRDTLEKIWEFSCPVSALPTPPRNVQNGKSIFTSGGCVVEMPDQSFFVSTCNPYGLVFIVNRNKSLLWSCNLEKWDKAKNMWAPVTQYRASPLMRKELEDLIWNSIR